jgi:hypothetical protein
VKPGDHVRCKGLKHGAFKLWVTTGFNSLYNAPAVVEAEEAVGAPAAVGAA